MVSARDAIHVANSKNQGAGILNNDYMAAFDLMVLTWVLEAKACGQQTQELVCKPSNCCRQGDRPGSILFCYGLDPHFDWLESRLRGIPICSSGSLDISFFSCLE